MGDTFHSFRWDGLRSRNCSWCQVAEGLVRTDGIVDSFSLPQFAVQGIEVQRIGVDLIELLGVGAVGTVNRAVEFRRIEEAARTAAVRAAGRVARTRRRTSCRRRSVGRGWGKERAVLQGVEEIGGGLSGGAAVGVLSFSC